MFSFRWRKWRAQVGRHNKTNFFRRLAHEYFEPRNLLSVSAQIEADALAIRGDDSSEFVWADFSESGLNVRGSNLKTRLFTPEELQGVTKINIGTNGGSDLVQLIVRDSLYTDQLFQKLENMSFNIWLGEENDRAMVDIQSQVVDQVLVDGGTAFDTLSLLGLEPREFVTQSVESTLTTKKEANPTSNNASSEKNHGLRSDQVRTENSVELPATQPKPKKTIDSQAATNQCSVGADSSTTTGKVNAELMCSVNNDRPSVEDRIRSALRNAIPTPSDYWRDVATILELTGNTFSAFALRHSLNSNPNAVNLNKPTGDLSNSQAHDFLQKLQNSTDLRHFVISEVSKISKGSSFQVSRNDFLAFNSQNNFDLYGALHKLDNVTISGSKDRNGNWVVTVKLTKDYNFEWSKYKRTVGEFIGYVGNNLAHVSQAVGIIQNYDIQATLTFRGKGNFIR